MKTLLTLILLTLVIFPAYAQEQSEQKVVLTNKGTLQVGLSTIPAHPLPEEQTKLKIDFINKNTKAVQEHIDYSITVTKEDTQVFGIPLTHTAIGSVTIPYEFQEAGEYKVSVDVQGILFQPIPTETASFAITAGKTSQPKNGCLIATAAFGSELAPQVQFLREYRDNTIMSTSVGSSFINAFNAAYYTFSPSIADVERNNPILQEFVRAGITPLLGILQIAKLSSVGSDATSVLTSGMMVSSLIGATYLWPAGLAIKSIREVSRSRIKIAVIIIFTSLVLTLISVAIGNVQFMMVSTSALVLSFIGAGAMFSSWTIWKIIEKIRITFL
ncbi:MAG TPA: CFI-box-CTERM domain-containing protein [Nitrosopumilaceae archaeon]|nr:CFI-box-CTERM domain-containing protein [Nitrosopumilaceae archaeon]